MTGFYVKVEMIEQKNVFLFFLQTISSLISNSMFTLNNNYSNEKVHLDKFDIYTWYTWDVINLNKFTSV